MDLLETARGMGRSFEQLGIRHASLVLDELRLNCLSR